MSGHNSPSWRLLFGPLPRQRRPECRTSSAAAAQPRLASRAGHRDRPRGRQHPKLCANRSRVSANGTGALQLQMSGTPGASFVAVSGLVCVMTSSQRDIADDSAAVLHVCALSTGVLQEERCTVQAVMQEVRSARSGACCSRELHCGVCRRGSPTRRTFLHGNSHGFVRCPSKRCNGLQPSLIAWKPASAHCASNRAKA